MAAPVIPLSNWHGGVLQYTGGVDAAAWQAAQSPSAPHRVAVDPGAALAVDAFGPITTPLPSYFRYGPSMPPLPTTVEDALCVFVQKVTIERAMCTDGVSRRAGVQACRRAGMWW